MFDELTNLANKTRYTLDAFVFVQQGLEFTARRIHGQPPLDPDEEEADASRHISGEQLCCGLRDFAIDQYGLLAKTVLRRWHVRSSEDFGHIVFAMVDQGLMHKTDDDDISDFVDVFDFDEAFCPSLQVSENG